MVWAHFIVDPPHTSWNLAKIVVLKEDVFHSGKGFLEALHAHGRPQEWLTSQE